MNGGYNFTFISATDSFLNKNIFVFSVMAKTEMPLVF